MKRIAKKLTIVIMAVVMALAVFSFAACEEKPSGNNNPKTYTVTVKGPDGNPYAGALVQACEVGNSAQCYTAVATNAQGVAVLEIGTHITNTSADELEIHIQALPAYLTYTPITMHKGEKKTIDLSVKTAAQLDQPISGNGEGVYENDWLTQEPTNSFDVENSTPYLVGEGAYELKFTSADQKIFYSFQTDEEGIYKVYSYGTVDAAVVQLTGSGYFINRPSDEETEYQSDNISDTDKNFCYEFEVSPDLVQYGDGLVYFEVSLKNAAHVNTSAIIAFEYVAEYEGEPETDTIVVEPTETLTQYANQDGNYIYVDLNGSVTTFKDGNGYYHLGADASAPLLVATLGKGVVTPRALNLGFWDIYVQGQLLSYYDEDDDVYYDYSDLIEAYTEYSNDQGRYPLTDDLIDFFTLYLFNSTYIPAIEDEVGATLPEGKEWLVWCGYYYVPAGTEADPFTFDEGVNSYTVKVPASGEVYYLLERNDNVKFEITKTSDNLKLKYYNAEDDVEDAVDAVFNQGKLTLELAAGATYFVFSTVDGNAGNFTITVEEEVIDPDGSEQWPFEIDYLDSYGVGGYIEDFENELDLHYAYTVDAGVDTLYFYNGTNATIKEVKYGGETKTLAQLTNGLSVSVGEVVTIVVTVSDAEYTFYVYDAPTGSSKYPIIITEEMYEGFQVTVPAAGSVYYLLDVDYDLTYTITSTSDNVKLVIYGFSYVTWQYDEVVDTVMSDGTFTYTFTSGGTYHLEFSTINESTDTYEVIVDIEIPEGTEYNPKAIDELREYTHTFDNYYAEYYYTFSVGSNTTLYFDWDDNTSIIVIVGETYYNFMEDNLDDLKSGIDVSGETEITIIVSVANPYADEVSGEVSFTISDSQIPAAN